MLPRASWRIGAAVAPLLALAVAPHLAWHLATAQTLDVVIVDKTAPSANFREHTAVSWLLHAMKITSPAGAFLDPASDYIGSGLDLTDADVTSADVLVVSGGVGNDEARVIEAFADRGRMVLGEFNTSAPPTADAARGRLEKVFGVRWTNWVARYWPDLQDRKDVPRWVGRIYERVSGHPFDLRGGGLVFVRADTDIVVLQENEDLQGRIVSQVRTQGGAVFEFPERGAFRYWMDIVDASASEVLYEHVLDTTPSGDRKLAAHGLPARFPAVTRRWEAWYFAGDFVDSAVELGSPERAWILPLRRAIAGCCGAAGADVFWGWYAPIVSRLLASRARNRGP